MKNLSRVLVWACLAAFSVPSLGFAQSSNASAVVTANMAAFDQVQVVKTDVSVRQGPSGKELAKAEKGASGVVLGREGGWYKVRFRGGIEGWIHSSMVKVIVVPKPVGSQQDSLPQATEAVLPDTPLTTKSEVDKPKRLTINIAGGKESIRFPDGTETVSVAPPAAPEVAKTKPVPEPHISSALPPLEAPRFAQPTEPSNLAAKVLGAAEGMRGITYRYGATGSRGSYDCSAFVRHVFGKSGYSLPRTAMEQFGQGLRVSKDELQPGDLVFFSSRISRVGHVGIYYGSGRFIHCSSGKNGVAISALSENYYSARYVGARRVLPAGQKLKGPVPVPEAAGSTDID